MLAAFVRRAIVSPANLDTERAHAIVQILVSRSAPTESDAKELPALPRDPQAELDAPAAVWVRDGRQVLAGLTARLPAD
jgi:hypothetical protein